MGLQHQRLAVKDFDKVGGVSYLARQRQAAVNKHAAAE
jgi:hypothetical protein